MNNFEYIKDHVDLKAVIEQDTDLKKHRDYYMGSCPFHNDKKPSFAFYPKTKSFYCYGCDKGGSVIDYVSHKENIHEPYEVVQLIAERFNLTVEGFDQEKIKQKKETVQQNRQEQRKYLTKENYIKAHEFLKERGFKEEITRNTFGVGYNPSEQAIAIPFLDTYGNIVGKSYRYFDEDKPKYKNSAESDVFKKSELLFGLDKARKHINDKVFIVEGYFDVMALYQMGYKESVAYASANITDEQARLLSKYIKPTTKIYFIPDNDETGKKQVKRNIQTLKRYNKNPISIIELPEGIKDANDVLKVGSDITDFETVYHEMYLLRQELDQCLEQVDEYSIAKKFVSYTRNEMIRYEMAEYLSKRWEKPKDEVLNFMRTKDYEFDNANVIQDFSMALDKYKDIVIEGSKHKIFFNMRKPDARLGGLNKSEVAFLIGRSGSGKTTFLLNFIHNAIFNQNKNIIFNSLELDSSRIAPQMLQIHFGMTEEQVSELILNDDPSIDPIIDKLNQHLRIIDRSGQSLADIERYINECRDGHFEQVDMVMIDYFGYIKREGKRDSYTEYSDMAKEIKQLAKRQQVLMFVLAQTNRTGKDGSEPLTMDSARDTGAIEESGDYVFGVYRPGANPELTEDDFKNDNTLANEYYLQTLKSRWSVIGKDKLWFDGETKEITNWKFHEERKAY